MSLFAHKDVGLASPIQLRHGADGYTRSELTDSASWEKEVELDWSADFPVTDYSPEHFQEMDRKFFSATRSMMAWRRIPFDEVIDFDDLRRKEVLEIGVGCGTYSQLLASHCRSFTGIADSEYASRCTRRRLACFGIPATIMQMAPETLRFPDDTFDFVWSWGAIDHSRQSRRILEEIRRVLRPGGRAVTMVCHRSVWNYYVVGGLLRGILSGGFRHTRSLATLLQRQLDGTFIRYYTEGEWRQLVADLFNVDWTRVYGLKEELLPVPGKRIREILAEAIPDPLARLLTTEVKLGSFLVTSLTKKRT